MADDDALSAYLRHHAAQALQGMANAEHGTADSLEQQLTVELVHDTRTSLRRLRAALRVFHRSFPESLSADDDLGFVARALSEVRDTDVLLQTLLEELDELPGPLVIGSIRVDLTVALRARRRAATEVVARARTRREWSRAAQLLGQWQQRPPRLDEEQPLLLLDNAREQVVRRIRDAGGDPRALHTARKAAKRWRYASELLAPVEPGAAAHLEAATRVHVLLGELQDAVVATRFLREHARTGTPGGQFGVTAGVLCQRAQQRIEDATSRAPHLL